MARWCIYVLHDETGNAVYVGVTNNMGRRRREHKKWLGFTPECRILEEGDGNRWEAEHKWIQHYRKLGVALLNKTEGGNGCETASAKTRRLLSLIGKGKKKPEGFGERLSQATKGLPRNWTKEGEQRVQQAQFKKGANLWAGLSPEEKQILIDKRNATRYGDPKKKAAESATASTIRKAMWQSMTPSERSALGKKIASARAKNHTKEELSEIASKNAKAAFKDPSAYKRASDQIKNWWASLTPEAKAEYVAKRAERIKAGWAAKRAKRAPAGC